MILHRGINLTKRGQIISYLFVTPQIIKLILISDKDDLSKYKKLFLNDVFVYQGKKAIQTNMALCEKVPAPPC